MSPAKSDKTKLEAVPEAAAEGGVALMEAAVVAPVVAPLDTSFDPFAALGIALPDIINDALAKAMTQDVDENLAHERDEGLNLAFAAWPQQDGGKYTTDFGRSVFIGKRSDDTKAEEFYHKEVPILFVDALLTRPANGGTWGTQGGKLMWPHTDDGQRDLSNQPGPACQSSNGVFPSPNHIGKEIRDFRTGEMVKIGFKRDLVSGRQVPVPVDSICATCPLGQWMKLANGKSVQICKNNFSWVVYAFVGDDGGQLVKVSGGNTGVQMALEGRDALNKSGKANMGARQDGAALPGIEHFFNANGKRRLLLPVEDGKVDLKPSQLPFVVGLTADAEAQIFAQLLPYTDDKQPNQIFWATVQSGKAKNVVIEIPTYPYAPQGRPEHAGDPTVPVYPILMNSVLNNFSPKSTKVPDFRVGDIPLTQEQYAAYLKARTEYFAPAEEGGFTARERLMGQAGRARIEEAQNHAVPPLISVTAPVAALPSGAVTVTAGVADDVTQGEFVTPDDLSLDD